jgi:hypothetical protein
MRGGFAMLSFGAGGECQSRDVASGNDAHPAMRANMVIEIIDDTTL